jgi:hypothetical protein
MTLKFLICSEGEDLKEERVNDKYNSAQQIVFCIVIAMCL